MRLLHFARNEEEQQNLHKMTVISKKDHKSDDNQHRVARKHSGLQQPDGIAEKLHQLGGEVQQAVDDPLIPPHGYFRNETGKPAGAVHAEPVDYLSVEAAEQSAEILGAIDDRGVVNFVDVIFMDEQL